MTASRRLGSESAGNRALFIEAAEQLLREEGYPSITSRKIAAKAGLKRQLLYYYFQTMDDVILAVVKKVFELRLGHFRAALSSSEPLRALWNIHSDPDSAVLASELQAIASHREAVRYEVARGAKEFRALQIEAVDRYLGDRGVDLDLYPSAAIVTIVAALARALVIDSALGVPEGYDAAIKLVERAIGHLEA